VPFATWRDVRPGGHDAPSGSHQVPDPCSARRRFHATWSPARPSGADRGFESRPVCGWEHTWPESHGAHAHARGRKCSSPPSSRSVIAIQAAGGSLSGGARSPSVAGAASPSFGRRSGLGGSLPVVMRLSGGLVPRFSAGAVLSSQPTTIWRTPVAPERAMRRTASLTTDPARIRDQR
jgi:hypothetical protein